MSLFIKSLAWVTVSFVLIVTLFFSGVHLGRTEVFEEKEQQIQQCTTEFNRFAEQVVKDDAFSCGLKDSDMCSKVCGAVAQSVKGVESIGIGFFDPMTQSCVCLFRPGE